MESKINPNGKNQRWRSEESESKITSNDKKRRWRSRKSENNITSNCKRRRWRSRSVKTENRWRVAKANLTRKKRGKKRATRKDKINVLNCL